MNCCSILSKGFPGSSAGLAEKFAALGASHADPLLSPQEAQRLIDALFASSNAELTPGGRRIVHLVPLTEIDKEF